MQWHKINIYSARLSFKPFSAKDAEESFQHINSRLCRYMAWEPPSSRQVYAQVWRPWLGQIERGEQLILTIRNQQNAEFMGIAGIHSLQSKTPELGIWIREDRQRQGYGKESIHRLVQWASQQLDCSSFIYPVAIENFVSRAVAESLGGVIQAYTETAKLQSARYTIPTQA